MLKLVIKKKQEEVMGAKKEIISSIGTKRTFKQSFYFNYVEAKEFFLRFKKLIFKINHEFYNNPI